MQTPSQVLEARQETQAPALSNRRGLDPEPFPYRAALAAPTRGASLARAELEGHKHSNRFPTATMSSPLASFFKRELLWQLILALHRVARRRSQRL